jgi:hypothetical protein
MNIELETFIRQYESIKWSVPEICPDNVFASDWPYAPVLPDVEIDFELIEKELQSIDNYFVPHREKDKIKSYGHEGWYSVVLHGISYDKTENYDRYGFKTQEEANYHWTEVCDLIPNTVSLIKSLPFTNYGRVRIMRLSPHGYIMPHTDGPGRIFGPYNFALTNPENCKFVFKDYGLVPFRQGLGFMLDIGNLHAIWNNSDQYRYHVIIHGIPNNNINQLIQQSIKKI